MEKRRLLCLGLTRSYLDRWVEATRKLDVQLVIMDSAERLAALDEYPDDSIERILLESEDLGDTLLQLRRENRRQALDGLFTSKDEWLTVVAQMALELGLPGVNPDSVKMFADKLGMRKVAERAGLRVARSFADSSRVDRFPVIAKPHDRSGSELVMACEDVEQLRGAERTIRERLPRSRIVIEERIEGKEISVEGLVLNGQWRVMGVTEKFLFFDSFVEQGHISPYPGFDAQAQAVVDRIMGAVPDIDFAPFHMELFLRGDEVVLGEVHLRFAGDFIVKLTEQAYSVDLIEPIFRAALGLPAEFPERRTPEKYVGVAFKAKNAETVPSSSLDRSSPVLTSAADRQELVRSLGLVAG